MEFKYLDYVCNGCNDLLILRVNISNIGIIAVKGLIIVALFITITNLIQLIC